MPTFSQAKSKPPMPVKRERWFIHLLSPVSKSHESLAPAVNPFVAIEAVETNVPPPEIEGLVPASKILVPFRFISTIAEAPEATVLVITETHCHVPPCGRLKGVWISVVGPETLQIKENIGFRGKFPVTDAPDTSR